MFNNIEMHFFFLALPLGYNDEWSARVYEGNVNVLFCSVQEIFACWILNWVVHVAGEGVGVALSSFKKGAEVYGVEYCAYVELRRPIFKKDQSLTAGEFQVVTNTGQIGVSYSI